VIEQLRIRSLGVIDESVLDLGPGLSVITGETGAGKTMLVTALGLLLGERADAGSVRTGAKQARVEGSVRADPIAAEVDDLGGEVEDGSVLLARQVSAEGRSRAFVGGAAVPASALSGLAERLVAVHGQSDQHRLRRAGAQREALDRYAGAELAQVLAEYAEAYSALHQVIAELDDVRSHARERAQEADLLRLGLAEIEAVAPAVGEDAELAAEETRLGNADTLRNAAEVARAALSADIGSDEGPDATGAFAAARRALDSVREHDPAVAALADRVAELSYLLADLAGDVAGYADSIDSDPARLASVSERRAAIIALTRKYGDDVAGVLDWAERAGRRLLELDDSDERVVALEDRREQLHTRLSDLAKTLTGLRTAAADELAAAVTQELHQLSMPAATFTVAVEPVGRFTPTGVDEIEFRLAANTGLKTQPLHKGASGGELSRVMLALEVVLANTRPVPTFVFDEVDAGVGGRAAVEIGRRLARLARDAQVLVVTHLPQVAAFADHHVVVRKSGDGSITTSGLTVLDDAGRVEELSRMLAGQEGSETAMAHAEELLEIARGSR
jgi:DNA repair protein RecN (Recombination protein N)